MKYARCRLIILTLLILLASSAFADGDVDSPNEFYLWLNGGRGLNNHGGAIGLGISTQYDDYIFSARAIRNYADFSFNEFFELALVGGFGIQRERYMISGAIGPGILMKQYERCG